jgi:hypothetical protein
MKVSEWLKSIERPKFATALTKSRLIFIAGLAVIIILALMYCGKARAADCPTPKPLTCDQLLAKAEQRHCLLTIPKETATAPCVPAPVTVNCPACKPVVQTEYVSVPVTSIAPAPKGRALFGGGPIYNAGWGLAAVAGYQWANGWQLIGGPNYIAHDDYAGSVTNCTPDDDGRYAPSHCGCVTLPYAVSGRSPWGGQLLIIKAF